MLAILPGFNTMTQDDVYDGYDPYDEDLRDMDDTCYRCGGDGVLEYMDAPETWGEDSPSEDNHLVTCPECRGRGYL